MTLPKYLEDLNEEQQRAVLHTNGPSLVIAGAGSGKTRVLTYRIAHLLQEGVKPQQILSLTFTNKAAREMKERVGKLVGYSTARYLMMGTFHSIFARILRSEAEKINYSNDYTIYDSSDSKNLIRTIIKEMKLDDKTYKPNFVASRISLAKNNLFTAARYAQNDFLTEEDSKRRIPLLKDIYLKYEGYCKKANAMDFDDLLLQTNILFRNHPDVLEKYQDIFQHIMVDEYQDTNESQYLIIRNLAKKHKNICVVGDDSQSIYSFRGAKIENILNFQTDYPDHEIFKLEQNYRSTQVIVNAANSVIERNENKIPKTVFSKQSHGEPIEVVESLTDTEEGLAVANRIFDASQQAQLSYDNFAILYRTNAQSRIFEESLRRHNIPYKVYGGLSFYQRKEIKDLLAYCRLVVNINDDEALRRIINYPARGIGQTTLTKISEAANRENIAIGALLANIDEYDVEVNSGTLNKLKLFHTMINSFREYMQEHGAYETAKKIASDTLILRELYKDKSPEGLSRYQNIEEILNGIQEFTQDNIESGDPYLLKDYLENIALITDQDQSDDQQRHVTLMTAHASKGLEFKHVYLVGLEEELFPSRRGNTISPQELEEERRLFYVAMTRAEDRVTISYAQQRYKWGQLIFCKESRFISELDPQYLNRQNKIPRAHSRSDAFAPSTSSSKKWVRVDASDTCSNSTDPVVASNIEDIHEGTRVKHQRFGMGEVVSIEGEGTNVKATVTFRNGNTRTLLLRFAKLQVLQSCKR